MDADNTGPVKIIPLKEGTKELKLIYAMKKSFMEAPQWRGGTIFYSEGTTGDRGPWKSDPKI